MLSAVVDASLPVPTTIWGFGVGGFLNALVSAGIRLDRPELVAAVRARVEPALARPPHPTDHLIPVEVLAALNVQGPVAARWSDVVTFAVRPVPGRPRVHRPDLTPWSGTIWVDCMHTDGPGLALLGRVDEAVASMSEYSGALQRPDGLFQHGYDVVHGEGNGVAWGRGQAWALIGLVGVLRYDPSPELVERVAALVEALLRWEDDGQWHTVVDDPTSPVEHSVAAYLAWLLPKASALTTDVGTAAAAARARAATFAALENGRLPVSQATPVGEAAAYCDRSVGCYPWGQAPVLSLLLDEALT